MRRLTAKDLEIKEYYQMPKWLYSFKELKPVDREIFMMSFNNWRLSQKNEWVNEKGEIYFLLSQLKLATLLYISPRTVIRSIEKLVEVGLLELEKGGNGKPNKYFLIEPDVKELELRTLKTVKAKSYEKKKENLCKNDIGQKTSDKNALVTNLHRLPVSKLHGSPMQKCHTSKNYTKNYTKNRIEEPSVSVFSPKNKILLCLNIYKVKLDNNFINELIQYDFEKISELIKQVPKDINNQGGFLRKLIKEHKLNKINHENKIVKNQPKKQANININNKISPKQNFVNEFLKEKSFNQLTPTEQKIFKRIMSNFDFQGVEL